MNANRPRASFQLIPWHYKMRSTTAWEIVMP